MDSVRIGTRRSKLALIQTRWVAAKLASLWPGLRIEIIEIVTTGDRILDRTLSKVPGKGVFVKEIEDRLLADEIDMAVHSMKDVPTELPEGLTIGAITERKDPRDVLVTRDGRTLNDLSASTVIGSSSLRRRTQLLLLRPDLVVTDIRGNIDTRLAKAKTDAYDGIILAAAGLIRMGWDTEISDFFDLQTMIPAVGQGALGIELREDDGRTHELIAPLNHELTHQAVVAERVFLAEMGGGCQLPMAAHCQFEADHVTVYAFASDEHGLRKERLKLQGKKADAGKLALDAAQRLIEATRATIDG